MKQLTYLAINLAAQQLMAASPISQTTTLEVKTLLRMLGYDARQAEISDAMPDVGIENNWFTSVSNQNSDSEYTVYSLEPIEEDEPEDDDEDGFVLFIFRTV